MYSNKYKPSDTDKSENSIFKRISGIAWTAYFITFGIGAIAGYGKAIIGTATAADLQVYAISALIAIGIIQYIPTAISMLLVSFANVYAVMAGTIIASLAYGGFTRLTGYVCRPYIPESTYARLRTAYTVFLRAAGCFAGLFIMALILYGVYEKLTKSKDNM